MFHLEAHRIQGQKLGTFLWRFQPLGESFVKHRSIDSMTCITIHWFHQPGTSQDDFRLLLSDPRISKSY